MAITLESRLLKHRKGEVLTPLLDRYFRSPPPQQSPEAMKVIQELATSAPRYRGQSFSASSLGSCMRAQTFRYLDWPAVDIPDPRLQGIFLNGKWLHLKWQAVLLEMGLVDADHLEVPVEITDLSVRGTIDAIVELNQLKWIVDFKGVNPQSFTKYKNGEINQGYHWQLQIYMKATGISRSLLLFENKATGEYFEQHVLASGPSYDEAMARLMALNQFMNIHILPPPLYNAPNNLNCRGCPYALDCVKAEWTHEYLEDEAEIPL